MNQSRLLLLAVLSVFACMFIACGGDDDSNEDSDRDSDRAATRTARAEEREQEEDDEEEDRPRATRTPDEPEETPTPEATATPTTAPVGGSRSQPAPIGTPLEVAGWSIQVNSVTADGTDLVMAENQFNDPPAEGRQFFIANITATYLGGEEESATLFSNLELSALGPSSVEYTSSDYCGVIPDPMDSFREVFEGGALTGNICWSVVSADASNMVMFAQEFFGDDDRLWFALR